MSGQGETNNSVSRWEVVVLSAFILAALLVGYGLTERRLVQKREHASTLAPDPAEKTDDGAPVVPSLLPPIPQPALDPLISQQGALTRRVAKTLSKPITLAYVFSLFPFKWHEIESFENFTMIHSSPLAGSVYSAVHGPVCVDFSWTPMPFEDTTYTLEIAKARDFAHYRSFGTQAPHSRIQFESGSDYFWRIRATRDREVALSSFVSFLVKGPVQSEEQKRIRSLATRVRDQRASLADMQYCR